jgi:hypothetical protein
MKFSARFHAWYAACAVSAASKEISVHLEKSSRSSSGLVGGLSTSGAIMRTHTASGVGAVDVVDEGL